MPAEPIRVESSRGPQFTMASTATWIGFWSVMMWICEGAVVSLMGFYYFVGGEGGGMFVFSLFFSLCP